MEMVLVLLISLVICQVLLLLWRNFHLRSYQVIFPKTEKKDFCFFEINLFKFFTLIAMWLIPVGLSIKFFYIRFILIWCCFTIITFYVTRRATRQPIEPNTPRLEKNKK